MAGIRRTIIVRCCFLALALLTTIFLFVWILNYATSLKLIISRPDNLTDISFYIVEEHSPVSIINQDEPDQIFQHDRQLAVNDMSSVRSYFTVNSLSEKPYVLHDMDRLVFPDQSNDVIKKLIMRLLISEYGDVQKIIIEQADLDANVLPILEQAFLKIRFSPGRIDGVAVPSALRIEVTLDQE